MGGWVGRRVWLKVKELGVLVFCFHHSQIGRPSRDNSLGSCEPKRRSLASPGAPCSAGGLPAHHPRGASGRRVRVSFRNKPSDFLSS